MFKQREDELRQQEEIKRNEILQIKIKEEQQIQELKKAQVPVQTHKETNEKQISKTEFDQQISKLDKNFDVKFDHIRKDMMQSFESMSLDITSRFQDFAQQHVK